MIEAPFYPIILIGDRADPAGDPFHGFNRGRHASFDRPAFAGLVMGLATGHGYVPALSRQAAPGSVPPRSLWPFQPAHHDDPIEAQATALGRFVAEVRAGVCGDDPVLLEAFAVILIGHGRGGLVGRCFLQNAAIPGPDGPVAGEAKRRLVDKLVTLGTDHGGPATEIRRAMALEVMDEPTATVGRLDPDTILCISAGAAPSAAVDGSAAVTVPGIPANLPSSPASFRNLERFLFGTLRVDLSLQLEEAELPKGLEEDDTEATYAVEVRAGLRGDSVALHVTREDEGTAVHGRRTRFQARPVLLTSLVLHPAGRVQRRRQSVAFGADLRLLASYDRNGECWRDDLFPGQALWADGLQIELTPDDGSFKVFYRFASSSGKKSVEVRLDEAANCCLAEIPIERKARPRLSGKLVLRIRHWNQPEGDYLVLVNE